MGDKSQETIGKLYSGPFFRIKKKKEQSSIDAVIK